MVILAVIPRDAGDGYRPGSVDHPWCPRAILDTGAPLSIFPHPTWGPFADAVWWLDQPPTAVRRVTILGGTWGYRLGRVQAGATDEDSRWLPAVWLNAFFLDPDPGAPREAVLGLRSRLLDGRRLRQEEVPSGGADRTWWLEDG
jgi:hypothetical protein